MLPHTLANHIERYQHTLSFDCSLQKPRNLPMASSKRVYRVRLVGNTLFMHRNGVGGRPPAGVNDFPCPLHPSKHRVFVSEKQVTFLFFSA